jgi:hypothetical protein
MVNPNPSCCPPEGRTPKGGRVWKRFDKRPSRALRAVRRFRRVPAAAAASVRPADPLPLRSRGPGWERGRCPLSPARTACYGAGPRDCAGLMRSTTAARRHRPRSRATRPRAPLLAPNPRSLFPIGTARRPHRGIQKLRAEGVSLAIPHRSFSTSRLPYSTALPIHPYGRELPRHRPVAISLRYRPAPREASPAPRPVARP